MHLNSLLNQDLSDSDNRTEYAEYEVKLIWSLLPTKMRLSCFSDGSSQLICFCCWSNRWITNVFAFHSNFGLCWIHHVCFWLSKAGAVLPVILFTRSFSSSKFILCSQLAMVYKSATWKYAHHRGQVSLQRGSETLSFET